MPDNRCPSCGCEMYGDAADCQRTARRMLVDTCITARGNYSPGYCAHHPTRNTAIDFGRAYRSRAAAARAYAANEWRCDPADVSVRRAQAVSCRYVAILRGGAR